MGKIAITQSNYIPWKGYFDTIQKVDKFILYDNVQYTKRDWRNRNKIKTANGLKWMSIPVEVKGRYFQKINETKIVDKNWNKSHLSLIKQSYKSAEKYKETIAFIEDLYVSCDFLYLSEINHHFITRLCEYLGIRTEISFLNDFELSNDKTQSLVNICSHFNCNEYFTGPAAKAYMDENLFIKNEIAVNFMNYSNYIEYNQIHPPFNHNVSILDLIFNTGKKSIDFI